MSCEVEIIKKIGIDDDERGYAEWELGDDIQLVLINDKNIFGEIKYIAEDEIGVLLENDSIYYVGLDEIERYL